MSRVIPKATHALARMTLFLAYLSEIKPVGVNNRIKGRSINALTIEVKTINSEPS